MALWVGGSPSHCRHYYSLFRVPRTAQTSGVGGGNLTVNCLVSTYEKVFLVQKPTLFILELTKQLTNADSLLRWEVAAMARLPRSHKKPRHGSA